MKPGNNSCPWRAFSCKGLELPSAWPGRQKFSLSPGGSLVVLVSISDLPLTGSMAWQVVEPLRASDFSTVKW